MSDGKQETVLITGANGFVGSRLCARLLDDGYRVIAGVREGCDIALIDELDLEYRFGDVTIPETLPPMVAEVDYIVHNAGLVKTENPDDFFRVNQVGTKNVIEAAAEETTLKKFIYISSMAAAGPSGKGRPRTEDDPPQPLTEYGRSKLAGERRVLARSETVNATILRPSGVYGPGDKEMFAFFNMLNNRLKPYLGNSRRKIQLVHVDDLAAAVAKSMTASTESGSIYFVAESQSYEYRALLKILGRAIGRICLPFYLPGRLLLQVAAISEKFTRGRGRPPMFTVDKARELLADWEVSVEKARREIGFESQITFAQGAAETAGWYRMEGWMP